MKSVLLSIKSQWCELMASGKKTVEVRKTKPKIEVPFKCYIYQSGKALTKTLYGSEFSKNGYVIGEFVCDKIFEIDFGIEEGVYFDGKFQKGFETNGKGDNPTCLSFIDLENYLTDNEGYGWHISDLKIYDKPKDISEFVKSCPFDCRCVWCKYYYRGSFYEPPHCDYEFEELTRPPQSYCYVEELI